MVLIVAKYLIPSKININVPKKAPNGPIAISIAAPTPTKASRKNSATGDTDSAALVISLNTTTTAAKGINHKAVADTAENSPGTILVNKTIPDTVKDAF